MISLPNWKHNKTTQPQAELYNLIYIGTSQIEFALCQIENETFKILDSESLEINQYIPSDFPASKIDDITNAIAKLITKSIERTAKQTKKTLIGIPSLYTLNQTTTLRINREKPAEKVDKRELEEINTRILANSRLEAEKKLNVNQNQELEIVNSDFSFIKLDGYLTKDIEGMRGSILEVSQFTSFSSRKYLNNLVLLTKDLKLDLVTITSSTYSLVKYIKQKSDISNYMLINFSGQSTDVGIIFGGELINTTSIRIGTESLISYISLKTEKDRNRVIETLKSPDLESPEKALQKTFENFWLQSLLKSLDLMEGIRVYPNIVLTQGKELLSIDQNKILAHIEKLKFKDTPVIYNLNQKINFAPDSSINVQSLGNFMQNLK